MAKKKQKKRSMRQNDAKSSTEKGANSRSRSGRVWLAGIAATVVAGVIAALLTWIGPEILDNAAAKDAVREAIRGEGDLRYDLQFLDPGYDLVLPSEVELTAVQEEYLDNWSLDYQDPSGYSLNRLVEDLRAAGGVNPNELLLSIKLEGRRNQPIHVDNVRPVNIRHTSPYSGTFLSIPPQGPGETVKMVFNFDEIEPKARMAIDDGSGSYKPGGLFFQEKTLTIEDAKQETVVIKSIATKQATTFDLRIDYRIGDESRYLLIDNKGKPFGLTPMNCLDRSQLGSDGSLITSGHASYEEIWSLRGDFQGIEKVSEPAKFEIGFPYC